MRPAALAVAALMSAAAAMAGARLLTLIGSAVERRCAEARAQKRSLLPDFAADTMIRHVRCYKMPADVCYATRTSSVARCAKTRIFEFLRLFSLQALAPLPYAAVTRCLPAFVTMAACQSGKKVAGLGMERCGKETKEAAAGREREVEVCSAEAECKKDRR